MLLITYVCICNIQQLIAKSCVNYASVDNERSKYILFEVITV